MKSTANVPVDAHAQSGHAGQARAGHPIAVWLHGGWLLLALAAYLALTTWQLGMPGLHYDEAREAGVNAMEMLTGAPISAFRGATFQLGGMALPLMVQDYIGALNVYLATPLLALTGIGVPNLRALSVITGLFTLLLLERTVSTWLAGHAPQLPRRAPLTTGGLVAVSVLACSPAFVFWSRQGIFVTNLMQPFVLLAIWMGMRWLRTGSPRALILCGMGAGFALYAKLMAVWVLLPLAILLLAGYLVAARRGTQPALRAATVAWGLLAFLLPLLPLLLFNLQTGGTWQALTGNLESSYYGVQNSNLLANLQVRLPQVRQVFEGSFLWYLGGIHANPLAAWLAAALVALATLLAWKHMVLPLLLVFAAIALSLVTISDLFITHFALLHVLLAGIVGIAAGALLQMPRAALRLRQTLIALVVVVWLLLDVRATIAYHGILAQSGGLADHSDASYDLAYHLLNNGMGSPIALDWGMDATVRFLTQGKVTPIEIFGYASPAAPDADFAQRLVQFLPNPDNVYLLHASGSEVFAGRRQAFEEIFKAHGKEATLEAQFAQRDGTPLYEIWRVR